MTKQTKKVSKKALKKVEKEVSNDVEQIIRQAVGEMEEILKKYGLGMQPTMQGTTPVIQIFKVREEPVESPILAMGNTNSGKIILPGSEDDLPPAFKEALKPIGDRFSK